MQLYLQFGYGMKALTIDLAKKWGGVSVILSPRDMSPKQLEAWSKDFAKNGVSCLFDPQCYCPKSELKRLSQYSYWNSSFKTYTQTDLSRTDDVLLKIKEYNRIANTFAYIIPNELFDYDDKWGATWLKASKCLVDSANAIMSDKPKYMTLTFPKGFLIQSEDIVEPILQEVLEWDVDGFYIIAEVPEKKYLVDNPMWLSNVFQICASLKLAGKKIIYGYGNHQMLPLSLLNADAIASGTWLNVRSFTNRFIDTDEISKRSTWVYYPAALSEYKLSFMDFAFSNGYLKTMEPKDEGFYNDSIMKIFQSNVQPSSTNFNETDAFKHYLTCLKHQIEVVCHDSYKETLAMNEMILNTAEREIDRLEKGGVFAQQRSFRDVIDVNRAAISKLDKSQGFGLAMSWNSL